MTDDPPSANDLWQSRLINAASEFAQTIKDLDTRNPWPETSVIDEAINTLMTELWDACFSQSQIRKAFEDAIADMPRYAAGEEARP